MGPLISLSNEKPAVGRADCSAVWVALLYLLLTSLHPDLRGQAQAGQSLSVVSPGTTRTNQQDGLDYVWIPPGTYQMGCSAGDTLCDDHEKPTHRVTISNGFWMGKTEVTVGAYRRFVQGTVRSMPPEPRTGRGLALNEGWLQAQLPIVQITWDESKAYCEWAGGRLPSEAEWEYGARAGTGTVRYGSLDDIAWYSATSGESRLDTAQIIAEGPGILATRFHENRNRLHEVGRKTANRFGLHDTLGNAWEWVADWYGEKYYGQSPSQDPTGPPSGQFRILRGGGWNSPPHHVRVTDRIVHPPRTANIVFGCRCVLVAK